MAYDDRALRGVGGWLAFFVLTLALFGPARGALQLAALLSQPTPPAFAETWSMVRAVSVLEFLLNTALSWFLTWRLIQVQNAATPRIVVIGLWAAALVLQPAALLLLAAVGGLPANLILAGAGGSLFQGVCYALIWTLYLQRSVRVANTYTDDQDALEAVFE